MVLLLSKAVIAHNHVVRMVTALTLVYNIIEALDDSAGSPADYREAVAFLRTLKRTLEPLETLSAFSVYPLHGLDITEEVAYIKAPVEELLAKVVKYEPNFAAKPAKGRQCRLHGSLTGYWKCYTKAGGIEIRPFC